MLTLFARTPDASACSVAPPMLEVWPSDALEPGQTITIHGYGFSEMTFHPWEDEYDADGNPIPQHSCAGIEITPMDAVVNWIGERVEPLAKVTGPEFRIEVTVPKWAQPGPAIIEARGFEAYVYVSGDVGCPVNLIDGTDRGFVPPPLPPECPDPCLGGPAIDVWCPDPCLYPVDAEDYLIGPDGCPDPCGWLLDQPIRPACPEPEPEPCLHHVMGFEGDHPPVWPECPWPCPPIELHADVVLPDEAPAIWPVDCPDPCWGAADILCPIPEPIPLPEPIPEPQPEPIPLPEPMPEPFPQPFPEPWPEPLPLPCLLMPDGSIICPAVLPAAVSADDAVQVTASAVIASGATGTAEIAATEVAEALPPVPAPPRPFIDFDGCRLDGADACG